MRLRELLQMVNASYCDITICATDGYKLVKGEKSDLLKVLSLATLDRYVVSIAPCDLYALRVTVSDVEDESEMGEHKKAVIERTVTC